MLTKEMESFPLISIIIPVFNGENYLRQCIDSVISQTYKEWELILIDDGSTDQSPDICNAYATEDKRIKVIHQRNSGQATARNNGLALAKGEYISFIDCDDWLEPKMYESFIEALQENQAEIAIGGYFKEFTTHRKAIHNNGRLDVYNSQEATKLILQGKIGSYLWTMLFKREVMQEPIANLKVYEDHATIFKWFVHAQHVVFIRRAYYHYRQIKNSCLHSDDLLKSECYLKAAQERYTFMKKHQVLPGWEQENRRQYLRECIKLTKDIARMDKYDWESKKLICKIREELKLLMPISCRDISLKYYLRLRLLMLNVDLYAWALQWSSKFLLTKNRERKNLFEETSSVSHRKKAKIVFLLSRFLDGGIDTVLIDYLNMLSTSGKYKLSLAIEQDMDKLEVFLDNVPENVRIYHFVENGMLMKWRRKKITQQISLPSKIYDESILAPIRRFIIKQGLKRLADRNDVIIDFDCCSYSLLEHITTPKIAWFHFSFEEMMRTNKRRMMRIGHYLSSYRNVVTISHAMYDEGVKLFPQLENKFLIIYNAKNRDNLLYRADEAINDERIRQSYILAVERLEESQKDISTLIRAYQILKRDYHHQEKLYLLGKGQSEEELRQLAASLGLADDVIFLGFHANPYPWMKHAKMLAHSAKLEGLPTVLLEGLMLDKLIVSTDCPTGPKEILDNGRAGLLVPVGNAEAMAEAIHRMLTDRQLQAETEAHIQQHRVHFMYEETLREFDNMIQQALQHE